MYVNAMKTATHCGLIQTQNVVPTQPAPDRLMVFFGKVWAITQEASEAVVGTVTVVEANATI